MKKILILLIAMMMLSGCSQDKKASTFMITRDNTLYALYNQDGKRLTDYSYKTFEEIKDVGYIITDSKDQKGFISLKGDEVIAPGTYETLEAVDQMLYASKKVEQKNDENKEEEKKTVNTGFIQTNFYILNGKGEVLYTADDKTGIKKSGLPIIKQNNEYIVLYHKGEELYKGIDEAIYAQQDNYSQSVVIGYKDYEQFYYYDEKDEKNNIELSINEKGTFKIMDQNEDGVILNDKAQKNMVYVDLKNRQYYANKIDVKDAYFDDSKNIILLSGNNTFVYHIGKTPVLMNSYYVSSLEYAARATDVYGPHHLYKDGKSTADLKDFQLYPEAKHIYSEIFPVYKRDTGFLYYNFDGQNVIKDVYLDAEPFDSNQRAIVKANDKGYSIIDDKGQVLTKDYYYQIKYIGSSYYAVYNETGMFGIVDLDGKEVFPVEYTSLPKEAIVSYDEENYMILSKNGRTYVYDTKDDMKVIFSNESDVVLNQKGYFIAGNEYYTFDGELIK